MFTWHSESRCSNSHKQIFLILISLIPWRIFQLNSVSCPGSCCPCATVVVPCIFSSNKTHMKGRKSLHSIQTRRPAPRLRHYLVCIHTTSVYHQNTYLRAFIHTDVFIDMHTLVCICVRTDTGSIHEDLIPHRSSQMRQYYQIYIQPSYPPLFAMWCWE